MLWQHFLIETGVYFFISWSWNITYCILYIFSMWMMEFLKKSKFWIIWKKWQKRLFLGHSFMKWWLCQVPKISFLIISQMYFLRKIHFLTTLYVVRVHMFLIRYVFYPWTLHEIHISSSLIFQDQNGILLEHWFMKRYPLRFKEHIMFFVNGILDELIHSIFHDIIHQLFILIFDSYLIIGLELRWLH